VTYVNILPKLDGIGEDPDEKVGVQIVRRALEEPLRQIAENAGYEGSVVVERIKAEKPGIGFNALTEKYEDMVKVPSSNS
jgi:Chaperonin GroEL (HSP60 family)